MDNKTKNLTDAQRKKVLAAADIIEHGDLAVLKKIIEFQDFLETYEIEEGKMSGILSKVEEMKAYCDTCMDSDSKEMSAHMKEMGDMMFKFESKIKEQISEQVSEKATTSEVKKLKDKMSKEMEDIRATIPSMPDLSVYENKLIEIEKKIPVLKDTILDTPDQVIEKINKSDQFIEKARIADLSDYTDEIKTLQNRTQLLLQISTQRSTGGGSSTFIGLTDVPASFASQGTKGVRVNAGETALEFYTIGAGAGDMVLASVQTNSGIKTFLDTTMKLRNVGNTFDGYFVNTNTADRIYTLPNIAGTVTLGTGTINELAYWAGTNTLGTLAVATYPSLTELSYVKGLTSSAQTQITAKAPSTAPTFATSITGSYLTASEILITDASKNIVSAPVATYPSLTELTYVKGVTSAIQTQLTARLPLAGGTMTGDILGAVSYGATGTRITKLWATDIESTNAPTAGGVAVPTISSTSTLTNKTMIATTNVVEEMTTVASSATPTPTGGSLRNFFSVTALAVGATFAAPSGTPADGNYLTIRILDNGTSRTLAWNAIYRFGTDVTAPTATVISKTQYIHFRYNSASVKWDCLATVGNF